MTDRPDRENEGDNPERGLVRRPAAPAPVERFTAPPNIRRGGLTAERSAQIVRQSSSARSVGFLAVLIIIVFVSGYYLYDTGIPGVYAGRQAAAQTDLQVTEVANGYALFEANCARCHGVQGQGLVGPPLNDQAKLLTHLTPQYLRNVLTVGGRYVCGNPNSLMPIWSDTNGGPLNYEQIADIIAFIRAPSTTTFQATDPATGQTVTMHGWRNPSYVLPAGATPVPACWSSPGSTGSPAPASAGPSGSGAAAGTINLAAHNVQFDQTQLTAAANKAFTIDFSNQDPGIAHNVTIYQGTSASGTPVFAGDTFSGPATKTYQVPALPAGTYTFVCTVHPTLMTGTLTVK